MDARRVGFTGLLLAVGLLAPEASAPPVVSIFADFENVTGVSKTTTTLQVVSNPILDREFTGPDGKRFKNPIHDTCYASLAALDAELVRYVPWFPYPHKSVAELDAPSADKSKPTSWDFTYIMPGLEDFMTAVYGRNHSVVLNFSTQPCWLFGGPNGTKNNCSYPANPDESFFYYVRGDRADLLDPTSKTLAAYYGRLMSWLVHGEFTDEHGVKHTGGPKYNLSRADGHVWELFNEAEHRYNVTYYNQDYDVIVPTMIAAAGEDQAPAFMGIGGASASWIVPFLNASNHSPPPPGLPAAPIDYFSQHHYASCSNRTDPSTYSAGFFDSAEQFSQAAVGMIAQRDASSYPHAKLDCDELGVIMPDDNDPKFGIDANLPDIYWNAAGAMYAYLFYRLAPAGVEVLGHSQLAGSPKIPEWGIPLPQYPSVSLLDWRTGYGNARYWALKILIEEFAPGDQFVATAVDVPHAGCKGSNPVCGTVTGTGAQYGSLHVECCDADATITGFDFADFGTPSGSCGAFKADAKCSVGVDKVVQWASEQCVGKRSCDLAPYPALGDPCLNVVKHLSVQARCSGSKGGDATASGGSSVPPVVALGMIATGRKAGKQNAMGANKVLVINTQNEPQLVSVSGPMSSGFEPGALLQVRLVDPKSVQASSPNGIRSATAVAGGNFTLLPFGIAVVSG